VRTCGPITRSELALGAPFAEDRGARDARLWSNLRGALVGESAALRVERHDLLECREGATVLEAWREGWTRHGTEPVVAPADVFWPLVVAALGFGLWRGYGRRPTRCA
jgi:hypothetical protein